MNALTSKDMNAFLIKGASDVLTGMQGPDARGGAVDIRVHSGYIQEVAPNLKPTPGETLIDASNCVVYPGWVNTHHHLFQSVMKGIPAGINEPLFGWLASVPYPRLSRITDADIEAGALVGLAELLLSGTTTCADHHYVYSGGAGKAMADVLFATAERLGIRFALCRGGATEPSRHPSYAKTMVPETLEAMLADIEHLVSRYHQPADDAMRRVVLAPTTPTFSVSPDNLRELARSARAMGIRLHSHLSETTDYVGYCREVHNTTPVEFCRQHEWLGPDVWFAHMVHVADEELPLLAETGTGVAHCPQSNCRLGSGVARIPDMAKLGIPISLAVDGAASNEAADMIQEAHTAWLVHRAVGGADATTVEDVVHWGTRGGAEVLGLPSLGYVAPGYAADLVVYPLDQLRYAGLHDPGIGPVVAGGSVFPRHVFVQGRPVVENGIIPGLDLEEVRAKAAAAVGRLA